jgi:hypothetical protein
VPRLGGRDKDDRDEVPRHFPPFSSPESINAKMRAKRGLMSVPDNHEEQELKASYKNN